MIFSFNSSILFLKTFLRIPARRYCLQIYSDETSKFFTHIPVMPSEVVKYLKPKDGDVFIDMTFGAGGHSKELLASRKDIVIIALDRDPSAYEKALELSRKTKCVLPILGKFSELPAILKKYGVKKGSINGILMDLGASSLQFEDASRGFSVIREGPLDMRMDGNRFPNSFTADDVVNTLDCKALTKIIKIYGEEKLAEKFANTIIDSRFMLKRISTTTELVRVVASSMNSQSYDALGRITSPATKVFQALRIFVNNEINELNYALEKMREYLVLDNEIMKMLEINNHKISEEEILLSSTGKIVVISFHSLEDKIVKSHFFSSNIEDNVTNRVSYILQSNLSLHDEVAQRYVTKNWFPISKKVITPSEEEIMANPRSRSAKLRAAVRIR